MTTVSFNKLAQQMDTLCPPTKMRDLLSRFSYINTERGKLPPGPHSLRAVASRLSDDTCVQLSFLHYNIWCLRATLNFKDLVNAAGSINHLISCLGLDLADFVGKMIEMAGIAVSDVCDSIFPPIFSACGISVNPANESCRVAGSFLELGGYIIQEISSDLDDIIEFFGIPEALVFQLLAEILDFDLAWLKFKPNILGRAIQIGRKAAAYDVVSLVEAWHQDAIDNILGEGKFTVVNGPSGSTAWKHLQSGILVLSPTRQLEDGGGYVYQADGVHRYMGGCDLGFLHDADKWANKGVQLTRIPLGFGTIDLYSTHLYSGGEFILADPSEEEMDAVRVAQVTELIEFIKATHNNPNTGNVALVAGDFNINASSTAAYQHLVNSFAQIGFYDLWNISETASGGRTSRHGDGGGDIYQDFNTHCKLFTPSAKYTSVYDVAGATPRVGDGLDYFCDEGQSDDPEPNVTGNRIDYIFVEQATATHSFNLDVSRIRRRVSKWPGAAASDADLSDHLGLEVTLFASPKH